MPVGLIATAACRLWLLYGPAWLQGVAAVAAVLILSVAAALVRSLGDLDLHPTHALLTCLLGGFAGSATAGLLLIRVKGG